MRKTFVIVGAGFSGTVLAAKLLRKPPPEGVEVVLIERSAAMGRGVAYAAHDFPYLLNVPAARSSADSSDPLQFLRFARSRLPGVEGDDFLPRALYGEYLQHLLLQAEQTAPSNARLLRVFGEVSGVQQSGAGGTLAALFADRPPISGDALILAPGNPSAPLPSWAAELRANPAFRQDPRDLPDALTGEQSVLILGNGLTMADAASALSRNAPHVPTMHTISRRGLIPKTQTRFQTDTLRVGAEGLLAVAHSLRRLLRASRDLAREIENRGGDWREAVTAIRNIAADLWQRMPLAERRRFVRHVQVHWDIHRHRLPPQQAERLDNLRRGGKLQIGAGRIQQVIPAGRRLRVLWRPRGAGAAEEMTVDLLVNATGPNYNIENSVDALINSLRSAGQVSADALNLGIRTASFGACVDAQGRVSDGLYYLGPLLRATHLDATAAAELCIHAERLAAHLIQRS